MRITTRLDTVRRDLAESKARKHLDFRIGTISGNLKAIIADENMEILNGLKLKKSQYQPII
jgi:hypothetical protein